MTTVDRCGLHAMEQKIQRPFMLHSRSGVGDGADGGGGGIGTVG